MAENGLVSFSLVFLAAAVAVLVGQAQGADICEKADHVPLCKSMVKGATDPAVGLKTAIELLLTETHRAKEESVKLGTMQSLDSCKQNFDSAIDDLNKSLEVLTSNDKGSLNTYLAGAKTFVVTCDDAVAEGHIQQLASGLLKTDKLLEQMADNCLYLATLLP